MNYLDVTQRKGAVPIQLPNGLGLEGAGRVTAIGSDVTNVAVGDRVVYERSGVEWIAMIPTVARELAEA